MCTLTAFKVDQDFLITMSRDEQISRQEAGLTSSKETTNTIFPIDAQSKGTWFGVNKQKVAMCLLNRYRDTFLRKAIDANKVNANNIVNKKISRGKIIPQALTYKTYSDIIQYINQLDFEQFDPFNLVIISEEGSQRIGWDGETLSKEPIFPEQGFILTSSSVDTKLVIKHREEQFKSWMQQQKDFPEKLPNDILNQFHLSQDQKNKSWAVLMDRATVHTKSITQVAMEEKQLELRYYNEKKLSSIRQGAPFNPLACEKFII